MKKISFLLMLISLTFLTENLNAQTNWVKPHATWHYSYSIMALGFLKIEHTNDTLLGGKNAMEFTTTRYNFIQTGPGTVSYQGETNLGQAYTWYSNDTVYSWAGDHYIFMMDLTPDAGDTWDLGVSQNASTYYCSENASINHVFSTGSVSLNNQVYERFNIIPTDSAIFRYEGSFNARFGADGNGSFNYLFPGGATCDTTMIPEYTVFNFTCFEDDSLYYNPSGTDCEYLLTHLGVGQLSNAYFSMYPNPSQGLVTIEVVSDLAEKLVVTDVNGKSVDQKNLSGMNGEQLQLELPQGFYFIQVLNDKGAVLNVEKLVIE